MDVTDVGNGQNWLVGAVSSDTFDASVWYYNVDYEDYVQFYSNATMTFRDIQLSGQFAKTDYNSTVAYSTAFGAKVTTTIAGFNLLAAYNNISDNIIRFDTFYTSSWNIFASHSLGDSFKFEVASELFGISAQTSYTYYEFEQYSDTGYEVNLLLGYNISDHFSIETIYTNTDYGLGDDTNTFEAIITYKF